MECLHGLQWWLHLPRLYLGLSLHQVSPCPLLLVRRLGRGLGRPSRLSGRFGPVGHPSGSVVYQRQGTASCSAGAFPVPVTSPRSHSGCLLRHLHSCAFPSQGGWPLVSSPQHLGSGDLVLDGVHLHPPASPVPSGLRHGPKPTPCLALTSSHIRSGLYT